MEHEKHFAIPSCIYILILTINFCCARYKFCKNDPTTRIPDSEVTRRAEKLRNDLYTICLAEVYV